MLTPFEIARTLDHSLLQLQMTDAEVRKGCEDAVMYHTASVCARPIDLKIVEPILRGSDVNVCTVIGFPHGSVRPDVKLFEAQKALDDGCVELDMVMQVGKLISGETAFVKDEIASICELAHHNNAIVKVILETCFLTDEQKVLACRLSEESGADFVKTSTGFGKGGATAHDVALMRASVGPNVRVKASGGIRSLDTALEMLGLGCSRIGIGSATTKVILDEANKRYNG